MAILEALCLPPQEFTTAELASRFRLDPHFAEVLLHRLNGVGLIKLKETKWSHTSHSLHTGDVSDASIRRHHGEYLTLALEALETQSIQERNIAGCVFSCDSRLLPEAFQRIEKFRTELMKFLETSPERDSVYRLSAQLFRLDAKK